MGQGLELRAPGHQIITQRFLVQDKPSHQWKLYRMSSKDRILTLFFWILLPFPVQLLGQRWIGPMYWGFDIVLLQPLFQGMSQEVEGSARDGHRLAAEISGIREALQVATSRG